ncbi:MAG: DUF1761 domain-containing protein [Candidatus Kerfeldbacteria bacterium]|nr:DUF1761 domain-containing protein [Candidatus Kerfeldbacteria bacterium]
MPDVTLNWVAMLVALIVSMVIGSLWYSKPVFGKAWMGMIGKSEEDLKKGAGKAMGIMIVATIIMIYVLSNIVDYATATTWMEGAQTGFWVWLGFVATVLVMSAGYEGRPMKLTAINAGFQLVNLVVAGAILAAWA